MSACVSQNFIRTISVDTHHDVCDAFSYLRNRAEPTSAQLESSGLPLWAAVLTDVHDARTGRRKTCSTLVKSSQLRVLTQCEFVSFEEMLRKNKKRECGRETEGKGEYTQTRRTRQTLTWPLWQVGGILPTLQQPERLQSVTG